MKRPRLDRFRLASSLRLLSASCLLLLAFAIFAQPLRRAVWPHAAPVLQHVPWVEKLRPPSRGFMVRVASRPSGAAVSIDGTARGSTPLFANVVCEQDQEVRIAIEKSGFPAWRRTIRCRVGGELTVQADLSESR